MKLSENPKTKNVSFKGNDLQIEVIRTPLPTGRVIERDGVLSVRVPAMIAPGKVRDAARQAVENWLKAHARTHILRRVQELSGPMKVGYRSVVLKDTRSRWGSCSRIGNLNFNWRIVMAPPWIIDYLVIHELAHLREMNHSERFWRVVEGSCPDFRNHRTWLRHCGETLLRW